MLIPLFCCPLNAAPLTDSTPVTWHQLSLEESALKGSSDTLPKNAKNLSKTSSYNSFSDLLARVLSPSAAPSEARNVLSKTDANTVSLRLPIWQLLRLQIPAADLPELWVANTQGLYRLRQWRVSNDPETFIFGDIDSRDRELLLRFAGGIPDNLHTLLTLGRTTPPGQEQEVYPLHGPSEWIDGKEYWRLNAGQPDSITLPEPADTWVTDTGMTDTSATGTLVITSMAADLAPSTPGEATYQLTSHWQEQTATTRIFTGGNIITRDRWSCPQVSRKRNRLSLMSPTAGAKLHISSDRDLLVRISRVTDGPYLFAINAPTPPAMIPKLPSRARYTLDLVKPGLHEWSEHEQALYRQSLGLIGNTYRDGALAAIELLDNQLETRPSDHLQALRNTLWTRVTDYRDLRPARSDNSLRLRFASINLPARGVTEASADFYRLLGTTSYTLTKGRHRKHFRLALTPLETISPNQINTRFARFRVSTNQGEALDFLLDLLTNTETPLPPGMALMDDGRFRTAASSATFTLPGNSGDKLSLKQLSGPPVAVALQMRNSEPFRLSEAEFMALLNEDPDAAFKQLMAGIDIPAKIYPGAGAGNSVRTQLLKAHLRPLWLQLEKQRVRFSAGIDEYTPRFSKIGTPTALQRLKTLSQNENWDRLVYASHPLSSSQDTHIRRSAIAARHLALSRLGEHRTAEHFLKLALFDANKTVRDGVAATLVERYLANQQSGRIIGLYTQLIRNHGDTQYLDPLIRTLAANGREQDALTLALLLPGFDPEHSAHLSLTQHWHTAFEQALTQLPPIRQQHWQALRALQAGEFDAASNHWRDAAMPKQASRAKLGADVLALLSGSRDANGSTQWLRWLSSFDSAKPGYSRRTVPQSLITGPATEVINNASASRARYYQVEPGSPVSLSIQGPLTLHITTRGVFDDPGDIDYSGWLNIHNGAQTIYFPLLRLPADNASNERGQIVSVPSSTRIHLGAGQHQLRFDADKAQLIRLQLNQSILASGLLPEPQTAALWGSVERVQPNALRHHWLDRYRQRPACHPQYRNQEQGQGRSKAYTLQDLFDPEQRFAMARSEPVTAALKGFAEAQYQERAQALLSTQALRDLANSPSTLSPQQAYPMALSALWYRDKNIISDDLASVYITIARRYGGENRRVAAFYTDIAKRYRWQLLDNVRDSAGIRKFAQSGATPGSAISRELFLKDAPKNLTRLLDPNKKLSFSYSTLAVTQLKFDLQQLVLPGENKADISVHLTIDGTISKYIRLLGNGRKRSYTLDLEPGPHQITFRVIGKDLKTRVALAVAEQKEEGFTALDIGAQHAYFVADTSTKVRIDTATPAFYRIDQRVGERVISRYRPVLAGAKPIVLGTGSQEAAYFRIYRFIEETGTPLPSSTVADESIPALLNSPNLALNWLGDVDGYILAANATASYSGDPDRGTWGLSVRAGESRQSDEDRGGGITPLYTQTILSYRRHFEDLDLYSRSEFAYRDYTGELDSAIGIRQWLDWYPENSNWHLGTYGQYYRQDVRERSGKASNDALLLRVEADHSFDITKTLTNKVRLQAFQQWLSLDDNDLAPGAAADPNVFSPYKTDHPTGWNITDRLTLDYWRDNRIYIEGELRSNSLGDPSDLDAYGLEVGVDQLYGQFTAGGNLHYRWYKNDADRSMNSTTRRLNLYLDWNRWRNSHGLQLGSDVSFDFDTGLNAWNVHLNWYFNSGDLKHFRPGELRFRSLQSRRLNGESDISPVWYK